MSGAGFGGNQNYPKETVDMVKCPRCDAQSGDHARVCAICGNVLPVRIVTMEEVLRSRVAEDAASGQVAGGFGPPQGSKPSAGQMDAGLRGAIFTEDLARLEKQLEYERDNRERAEMALEEYRGKASARDYDAERLQASLLRYQKYINKKTLCVAGVVVLLGLILIIAGFTEKGGAERKLAEYRGYKIMYDSVTVASKKVAAERDALRRELTGLKESHAAAQVELEELSAQVAPAKGTSSGVGRISVNIEMVPVQGGTFEMGCTAEQGGDCGDDERPVRSVAVGSFSIGRFPVTQGQWRQVMGTGPSHYKGDNLPVERVSWRDAQEFIRKLNRMTGKNYRLPTEAEWEYAARGGARSRGFKYSGSNHIEEVAWYARTVGTTRVGTRKSNELGVHDMSGNVSEWVSDRYAGYGEGSEAGEERVLRGGSWSSVAKSCRVSNRSNMPAGTRGNNIGFRLAM
ncbi:MAG: formylglycine-generating enzyme family protein [Chitinispirillia bacterium]|nr:formylglycine-generating enzyme family protein [Chitinispirillia bacterium]MCL2269100.1 formylglycine-generating enzyme family protein [Chitinispirillia bacterium]